jgi:uncharacterized protein (TIGR03118 family)
MDVTHASRAAVGALVAASVLAACGGGNSALNPGPAITPAAVTLAASPTTITAGESVTLTWTSSTGTSCSAGGAWSGAVSGNGSKMVTPTAAAGTATFVLACAGGSFSSTSANASVTVTPASAYSWTSLVADTSGTGAAHVDPNLVNAFGLSIAAPPATNPAWVANNHSQTSTLYNGTGSPIPLIVKLVASASGAAFDPTGIVYNPSPTDFIVTEGGTSGSSAFIYDGEGGVIAGWSASVDLTHAVNMYTDAGGASYAGLAIAANGGHWYLYATDFHNAKVDVFDTHFTKQATSASAFTFSDPMLPAGVAPFGIQAITSGSSTLIYVTYAQQTNTIGPGLGYVDVFDTNGQLVTRLIWGGWLNAPWGLALAPADFGTLSNALLVGNFGDGTINGYDVTTGAHLGTVSSSSGAAIVVPGLWGIAFGNDAQNQPDNTLFATSGPNEGADGGYGRIDLGATPPTLGAAPVVTLTAPASPLTGTVSLTATVTDTVTVAKVEFWADTTLLGTATTSPYMISWDTTAWANGPVTLTAHAWDTNGNVGSSAVAAATIAN